MYSYISKNSDALFVYLTNITNKLVEHKSKKYFLFNPSHIYKMAIVIERHNYFCILTLDGTTYDTGRTITDNVFVDYKGITRPTNDLFMLYFIEIINKRGRLLQLIISDKEIIETEIMSCECCVGSVLTLNNAYLISDIMGTYSIYDIELRQWQDGIKSFTINKNGLRYKLEPPPIKGCLPQMT